MKTLTATVLIYICFCDSLCSDGLDMPDYTFAYNNNDPNNASNASMSVTISSADLDLCLGIDNTDAVVFNVHGKGSVKDLKLKFMLSVDDVVDQIPDYVINDTHSIRNFSVPVTGKCAGRTLLYVNSSNDKVDVSNAFIRIIVYKLRYMIVMESILGWIYFIAWSISFYPQIYENWRRKSVIGLNFDFLALNVIGFSLYAAFNISMYWSYTIQRQYMERHGGTVVIPVKLNDVVFAVHATFACLLTIYQCYIYERGNQVLSRYCKGLIVLFILFLFCVLVSVLAGPLEWLDFLLYASYVKLFITLIKYIPQGYMNFRRKSTSGWSIGNVILDFIGGFFSIAQMIVISYNYNDWSSFFGDPTKFGLGLLSVCFDILFFIQHYILYRHNEPHELLTGNVYASYPQTSTERNVVPMCASPDSIDDSDDGASENPIF